MRLFSVFFLLGTLIIHYLDNIPLWSTIFILFGICFLLWGFVYVVLKQRFKFIDLLIKLFFAVFLGFFLSSYQVSNVLQNRISPDLEGKELLITGSVKNIPSIRDGGNRFLFNVTKAIVVDKPETKIDFQGLVRLGWFRHAEPINAGEFWRLKVKLKRPSGFMNPGGFDYEKWLFSQKIIATGYVRNTKNSEESENIRLNQKPTIQGTVNRWRQKIHEAVQESVNDKSSAAMLSALLVAVRDNLDSEQWQLLQSTGTSHLVAISGLHIAVVAGFAFFPIMFLWRLFPRLNERITLPFAGALMGALFALCYAMLAGFTLPTQRAFLIVSIVLWGLGSRRNYHSSTILSMALILVLLWDPLAAISVSFWLSFLAVSLILFFLNRQIVKPRWMFIKLQIFLSLAMLPLTLLFFGSASLTSPVANLIAIPWVSLFIVPISLLGLLFIPISDYISGLLFKFAAFGIDIFFQVLAILSNSPLASVRLIGIPPVLLIIAFLGFLFMLLPKGFPARWMGLLFMLPIFVYEVEKPDHGEFNYTLLDVGQGYASVLQTKNHTLIYDAGVRVSDTFDLGKLVVAPYLEFKGVKKINKLMISHEDIDHRGGAEYLINNFQVDEIITSDTTALANSKECIQGQNWQWDDVNFEVLFPEKDFDGNDNNRSCVLKVWNQHYSLLLTGDIQKQAEKVLLATIPEKLTADILSVPHHGSKTSSTIEFIRQVSPKIGLISAGYRSRFGHPKPTIVERYKQSNIELLDTVNHGAITLTFPANNTAISREYYRKENKGFWSR